MRRRHAGWVLLYLFSSFWVSPRRKHHFSLSLSPSSPLSRCPLLITSHLLPCLSSALQRRACSACCKRTRCGPAADSGPPSDAQAPRPRPCCASSPTQAPSCSACPALSPSLRYRLGLHARMPMAQCSCSSRSLLYCAHCQVLLRAPNMTASAAAFTALGTVFGLAVRTWQSAVAPPTSAARRQGRRVLGHSSSPWHASW